MKKTAMLLSLVMIIGMFFPVITPAEAEYNGFDSALSESKMHIAQDMEKWTSLDMVNEIFDFMSAYIASRELNFRQALGLKDNLAKGYNTIQYTDEIEQLPKDNLGNVFADSSIRLTESERAEGLKWITNDCGIVVEEANVYFYYGDFKIISDDHCEMNVYEWNSFTWKDIDSTIIESGFGTWHYLSLEKLGEGKLLVRDEYDEIGISNVDTVSLEKREILENQKNLDTHNLHEDHLPLTTTSILPANVTYNPFAAISYANSYVNPDTTINNTSQKFESFYNRKYQIASEDCTNYVSQALYAGGLPMTNKWYYYDGGTPCNNTSHTAGKSGSHNCTNDDNTSSSPWFNGSLLNELTNWGKIYMPGHNNEGVNNFHYRFVNLVWNGAYNTGITASNIKDQIKPGNPIFMRWNKYRGSTTVNISHVEICVGISSNGVPLINSHNNDKYQMPWNHNRGIGGTSDWTYDRLVVARLDEGQHSAPWTYYSNNLHRQKCTETSCTVVKYESHVAGSIPDECVVCGGRMN